MQISLAFFSLSNIQFFIISGICRIIKMVRTKTLFTTMKPRYLGISDLKRKIEKQNLVKLCATKLSRISDPQTKLRKAVLINNTLKNLQRDQKEILEHSGDEENDKPEEPAGQYPNYGYSDSTHEENATPIDDKTQSLCDDIIKEFLGVCDYKKDNSITNTPNSVLNCYDKYNGYQRNISTQEKLDETFPQLSRKEISPYSYSSFLSEVYRNTLKCGAEL